jgi:DNA polymerase epsilon subunit 1
MLKVVDLLATVFYHAYDRDQHTHHNHRQETKRKSAGAFPVLAGSHLVLTSPALEFVKATTHIMSLDTDLAEEVARMKRSLLMQLRVKEFSEESRFCDPSLSFVLRDVICSYCSTCRDIDLLRDSVLCDASLERSVRWRCSHCGNGLNVVQVENRYCSSNRPILLYIKMLV